MRRLHAACAALLIAATAPAAWATAPIGAPALTARYTTLAPALEKNAFGRPLHIESQEVSRRMDGDVYALVDHPFDTVAATLADPNQWCDILILHLNTKYCHRHDASTGVEVEMRVGKKEEEPLSSTTALHFHWHAPVRRADYFLAQMDANDGPYNTRDYQIVVEAVPLAGGKTFMHMSYAFSYSGASRFAMELYLGTVGRDKVGFTRVGDGYVKGMRGIVERNTMRYFLAIRAYLDSLALPPSSRLDARLQAWFDGTEQYARQLHELERDEYLQMKRNEVRRQLAQR